MSRARWAAWGLAASLGLISGCTGLCNRPLFNPCCRPSCGCCAGGTCALECAECGEGLPVSEGPLLQDYAAPTVVAPPAGVIPHAGVIPPAGVMPPAAVPPAPGPMAPLSPQPTVPPLSPPPQRLVPEPAVPGAYRP